MSKKITYEKEFCGNPKFFLTKHIDNVKLKKAFCLMAIKRQTYNTACKDGCDVGDEPLRRVEPPDCDAVVSFETEEEKGLCHAGDVPQVLVVAPVLQFSVPPDRHGDAVTSVLNNSCKIILY